DMENVQQGAIGLVVIRNPADPEDDPDLDLPGGLFNGLPTFVRCFPPPFPLPILPHDLDTLGQHGNVPHSHGGTPEPTSAQANPKRGKPAPSAVANPEHDLSDPVPARIAKHGDLLLELDPGFTHVARLCFSLYRPPPAKA